MTFRWLFLLTSCATVMFGGIFLVWEYRGEHGAASSHVDFSRDIRPIFNQNCVSCHGGVKQAANVSFIYREEALGKGKSGRATVVPGRPDASELITRVTSRNPEVRMPLHAPPLPPKQIALLRQWIQEGAQWENYWAFVAPKPQTLPEVKQAAWVRQPLDRFILARLEKEGLAPSPEADKAALLRRVSFDLVGLPPTPEELAAFLADSSADAYEKQVDRLLASPRYGERWASMWLDLARYADTQGYEEDPPRLGVWPYRDWVIDAFNRNLPYDQFVITQLAGDLLPDRTFSDLIATSFQRQSPNNNECGSDDEEYRLLAVMDRVATTWSVLNGVTINCVQCHSHPYDPIRHQEYYKFLAFYNTSRDADLSNDSPVLPVPKQPSRRGEAAQLIQQRVRFLEEIVDEGRSMEAHTAWTALPVTKAALDEALAWEQLLVKLEQAQRKGRYLSDKPMDEEEEQDKRYERLQGKELQKFLAKKITEATSELEHVRSVGIRPLKIAHGEVQAEGNLPVRSAYELLTVPVSSAVTAVRIEVPPADSVKSRHNPEDGFAVDRINAWALAPTGQERKIAFRYFVSDSEENLERALKVGAASDQKPHVFSGGDGIFTAISKQFQTRWIIGIPEEPLPAGSRLKLQLLHSKEINAKPGAVKHVRVAVSGDTRWSRWAAEARVGKNHQQLLEVQRRLDAIPTVPLPVMVEQRADERRETLEFERGNFLNQIGATLTPDVPALFPKLPANAPRNRLTMARWFFAPSQPLTARVAVNRYWEQMFGTGLVETLEDFGSSGERPSHPELLDWLALHFQNDLHWNMKALLRELATSATYRQSAKATPALLQKDLRNRLLARGPQQRLTAEMVRDQALVASGLLVDTIGGPPVMPPQPASLLMEETQGDHRLWDNTKREDRYRRAVYTYLRRTSPYPSFITFDASNRSVSLPRRIPTNTPLQALVTLNDPVYQEAAGALAKRIITNSTLVDARLTYGVRAVLSRDPQPRELEWLREYYEKTLVNDRRRTAIHTADAEWAAWTAVASVLLNIDSALVR